MPRRQSRALLIDCRLIRLYENLANNEYVSRYYNYTRTIDYATRDYTRTRIIASLSNRDSPKLRKGKKKGGGKGGKSERKTKINNSRLPKIRVDYKRESIGRYK